MKNSIEIKNVSKRYSINHQKGKYIALRDILAGIVKNPLKFLKGKVKEIVGIDTKGQFWALRNIDLEIKKGEVVGIIGANGAGKSTLLKLLSRITPPTTGEIKLDGKVASLLEVGTGFHPELTGRENIFLNGAILGMSKKELIAKFDDIVEFSGVEQFIDTPVKRYSSGMYVRLAFAVAAHMEPDILIVDEVLAVGDAEFQKKCLGKLDSVAKTEGRTILFVSHNMDAIQKLCSRTILLEKGEISMIGDTKRIINEYLKRVSSSMTVPLKERTDRTGNGNIIFEEVRFSGKNNSNIYSTGDDIFIHFKVNNKLSKEAQVNFILNILTPTSQPLISCDSLQKDQTITLPPNSIHDVVCKIDSPSLSIGDYYINIGILHKNQLEDRIASVAEFSVNAHENSEQKRFNPLFPIVSKFNWEIN